MLTNDQIQLKLNQLEALVKSLLAPKSKARLIVGSGSESSVCKTPGSGIAARSGTSIYSAACTVVDASPTFVLSDTTEEITVFNLSTSAVSAGVYIVAVKTNIGWIAVWEDC